MAEPYLRCPPAWRRATLAPDPSSDLVVRVETGSTPSTKRPEYWDGDIPWLTPKEVTDPEGSVFVSRTTRSITREGLASSAAKLMAPGTVMLTKRAPVGAVVVNTVPMATNQGFLNFTCGSALLPAFLAAWLKANKPYLDLIANGSTYPELYLSDLFEFEIAVPPIDYQHRVVEIINSFQVVLAMESALEQLTASPDELHLVHAKVRKLRTLRETLLPLLLSGEVALPASPSANASVNGPEPIYGGRMTTAPSEPGGTAETGTGDYDRTRASHLQRQVAEGFGTDAGRYDRARPSYPADLVDRIIAASPGRAILDVGCGTGISARLFQAAGCQVLGVDPDPRMAELARQGGTEAEVAKFEDWDPAGRAFDAVVSAQAWHWVDPVAGAAKAAAVLRPGGRLAVFWNAFDPPKDLREAFAEVFRRVLPDSPFGGFWARPAVDTYRAGCAKVADVIRQAGTFGEPEEWLSYWERPYTRDEWLDLVPTTGGFTRHPEAIQAELLDGLGAAVDAAGGTFTMSYTTIAATATRAAAELE